MYNISSDNNSKSKNNVRGPLILVPFCPWNREFHIINNNKIYKIVGIFNQKW